MENPPKLGEIITGQGFRDAIHVAVLPVTAGEQLRPGDRVGISPQDDGSYKAFLVMDKPVGIIDPFLVEDVLPGQKCYLLFMPNSVTGLRHVYSHPSLIRRLPERKS